MIRTKWRMIFGAIGVHDSDIGHRDSIVNRAAGRCLILSSLSRTHRQPSGKDLWRIRNRRPARQIPPTIVAVR
jgi:hypothetical protein